MLLQYMILIGILININEYFYRFIIYIESMYKIY